jgi:hypothetical protein
MVRLSGLSGKVLSKQQKAVMFGSWFGWSLDGYDLVLMLFVISSVNQLFFPSNNPTHALALNIIIGAVIIFVGSRLNPDTRSVELG